MIFTFMLVVKQLFVHVVFKFCIAQVQRTRSDVIIALCMLYASIPCQLTHQEINIFFLSLTQHVIWSINRKLH